MKVYTTSIPVSDDRSETGARDVKNRARGHITIITINDTLARSLEAVVTECKEHTIHTQTQIVASRKPKEIKHTHEEGDANFTTESAQKPLRTTTMLTRHGKISSAQRPITYHRPAATDAVAGRHAKDDKHTPIMW